MPYMHALFPLTVTTALPYNYNTAQIHKPLYLVRVVWFFLSHIIAIANDYYGLAF
jgi:hypothetical protein